MKQRFQNVGEPLEIDLEHLQAYSYQVYNTFQVPKYRDLILLKSCYNYSVMVKLIVFDWDDGTKLETILRQINE